MPGIKARQVAGKCSSHNEQLAYFAIPDPRQGLVDREEKLYEREEIFGRDASSVFPTEGKATQPTMDVEATKAAIGALKFISESEVIVKRVPATAHLARQLRNGKEQCEQDRVPTSKIIHQFSFRIPNLLARLCCKCQGIAKSLKQNLLAMGSA